MGNLTFRDDTPFLSLAVRHLENALQFLLFREVFFLCRTGFACAFAMAGVSPFGAAPRESVCCPEPFSTLRIPAFHFRTSHTPCSLHMHHFIGFIPLYDDTRTMGAENRISRVFHITVDIVAYFFYHFFLTVTLLVSPEGTRQVTVSFRIGCHLDPVILHFRYGSTPRQHHVFSRRLRLFQSSVHPLYISHGSACRALRHFQPELIPWLQQYTFCFSQPLPQRSVGGLSEIAAFRMLQVTAACKQCYLHIGYGRACQGSRVLPLRQMCQNEPLPVPVQYVFAASGI